MNILRITISGLLAAFVMSSITSPAAAAGVKVGKEECRRILKFQLGNAEYKPGVDARGKKVKGANLGGASAFKVPSEINIDLNVDLAEKYGFDDKGLSATQSFGKISYRKGRVYLNGKPMDGNDQGAIVQACRDAYGK